MTRTPFKLPTIIQGGMGVGVSGWSLAKTVSRLGQLGVVSGTALDSVFVRRLQNGDVGGHLRRALKNFPNKQTVDRILNKYFLNKGKPKSFSYKRPSMLLANLSKELQELLVVSNFVEVFLAREGHDGPVGINYLEKLQMATVPSLYGAMLAGVTYVLIGAGIPREIPSVIDKLVNHSAVELRLNVEGAQPGEQYYSRFSPRDIWGDVLPPLPRPNFLPIVSSTTLALNLAKKSSGRVDGFVIEGPTAGGHNAPPRGSGAPTVGIEPRYGPRDQVDLEKLRQLGLPFWLAGEYGSPEGLDQALQEGAAGIQVGSAFALCEESGLQQSWKEQIMTTALQGELEVITDGVASPTGFPFKVSQLAGTLSDQRTYEERPRICDLGYLRRPYRMENGKLGYRCPAEPTKDYVAKGGTLEATVGRKCLCNALMANIGLAQLQKSGYEEKLLVTLGNDARNATRFLPKGSTTYSAKDVVRILLRDHA